MVLRPNNRFFVAVTGAQGVGKSTFCNKLFSVLSQHVPKQVSLAGGLGDEIRASGFVVGSAANAQSVAAVFSAHLRRERNAPSGIIILDRCVIDALAYVRALNVNTPAEIQVYEEVAHLMSTRLGLAAHLLLSNTFRYTGGDHETAELRNAISKLVPQIIGEFGTQSINIDAAKPESAAIVATAVLSAIN